MRHSNLGFWILLSLIGFSVSFEEAETGLADSSNVGENEAHDGSGEGDVNKMSRNSSDCQILKNNELQLAAQVDGNDYHEKFYIDTINIDGINREKRIWSNAPVRFLGDENDIFLRPGQQLDSGYNQRIRNWVKKDTGSYGKFFNHNREPVHTKTKILYKPHNAKRYKKRKNKSGLKKEKGQVKKGRKWYPLVQDSQRPSFNVEPSNTNTGLERDEAPILHSNSNNGHHQHLGHSKDGELIQIPSDADLSFKYLPRRTRHEFKAPKKLISICLFGSMEGLLDCEFITLREFDVKDTRFHVLDEWNDKNNYNILQPYSGSLKFRVPSEVALLTKDGITCWYFSSLPRLKESGWKTYSYATRKLNFRMDHRRISSWHQMQAIKRRLEDLETLYYNNGDIERKIAAKLNIEHIENLPFKCKDVQADSWQCRLHQIQDHCAIADVIRTAEHYNLSFEPVGTFYSDAVTSVPLS